MPRQGIAIRVFEPGNPGSVGRLPRASLVLNLPSEDGVFGGGLLFDKRDAQLRAQTVDDEGMGIGVRARPGADQPPCWSPPPYCSLLLACG
jgi:hypothetical protein